MKPHETHKNSLPSHTHTYFELNPLDPLKHEACSTSAGLPFLRFPRPGYGYEVVVYYFPPAGRRLQACSRLRGIVEVRWDRCRGLAGAHGLLGRTRGPRGSTHHPPPPVPQATQQPRPIGTWRRSALRGICWTSATSLKGHGRSGTFLRARSTGLMTPHTLYTIVSALLSKFQSQHRKATGTCRLPGSIYVKAESTEEQRACGKAEKGHDHKAFQGVKACSL